MLSQAERQQLLVEWNNIRLDYPAHKTLSRLFEEQAERTPLTRAVSDQARSFSYSELNEQANRLAHYLVELGVGPEVRVGLYMQRSGEMIMAMLAIHKAGGAYV